MQFCTDPFWYDKYCVYHADVLQSTWLANGELITADSRRVSLKWAAGEFQYFTTLRSYACYDFSARQLAQKIYWLKLRKEFEDQVRWNNHAMAWKARAQAKIAAQKAKTEEVKPTEPEKPSEFIQTEIKLPIEEQIENQKDDTTTTAVGGLAEVAKDVKDFIVAEKVDKIDVVDEITQEKTVTEIKIKETKKQPVAEKLIAILTKTIIKDNQDAVVGNYKDESGSDMDDSKSSSPMEGSTAETTPNQSPEQTPKSSTINLLSLENTEELGGSKVGKSKKGEKPAKGTKMSKSRERRQAKKDAKLAASLALSDQSEMFKLSKLGKL